MQVTGFNFTGGSEIACRFGSVVVPGALLARPASNGAGNGAGNGTNGSNTTSGAAAAAVPVPDTVECACVSYELPAAVPVEIALNGQQFTADGRFEFSFTASVITLLSTVEGPASGGTEVAVHFSFPGND